MKINIIIFLVLICLVSCSSKKDNYVNITCPETFISTEHQNYFFTKDSLKLKNFSMEYIGTINNFRIQCQKINEDAIISSLDILFILTPLNEEIEEYNLSYFVKILDENKNILDSQLFNINGKFNLQNKETEITKSLDQYLPIKNINYNIVIGFALTEEKYKYINN